MTKLIEISDVKFAESPSSASEVLERGKKLCIELERGNILFFPQIPFLFPTEDQEFLLRQKQTSAKNRKNIAYKPKMDRVTNVEKNNKVDADRLHSILRNYSQSVNLFLSKLLTPYARKWQLDYASFRPFQEMGRNLRLRARNDLLHVDAFPSRPMHGSRILRFFTNINTEEAREWITSDTFDALVKKYGGTDSLPFPKGVQHSFSSRLAKKMKRSGKKLGIPLIERSPYDQFMLKMHNFLKENTDFQRNAFKNEWSFPAGSCWMVYTDQVTHAALSGQYALEQTLLIPRESLIHPENSPVSILERMAGQSMVDLSFAN